MLPWSTGEALAAVGRLWPSDDDDDDLALLVWSNIRPATILISQLTLHALFFQVAPRSDNYSKSCLQYKGILFQSDLQILTDKVITPTPLAPKCKYVHLFHRASL